MFLILIIALASVWCEEGNATCTVLQSCVIVGYKYIGSNHVNMCIDFNNRVGNYGEEWTVTQNSDGVTIVILHKPKHSSWNIAIAHLDKYKVGETYECWQGDDYDSYVASAYMAAPTLLLFTALMLMALI